MTERALIQQAAYLAASVLFILALRHLNSAATARRGVLLAEIGMLLAVVGTIIQPEIVSYEWIALGLAVGAVAGVPLGLFVPMTAMPQRIAVSHMFGALAVTLVGVAEYHLRGGDLNRIQMTALGFEVLLGSLTITGSFMAFAKLAELVPGRPFIYPFQNQINISIFVVAAAIFLYLIFDPAQSGLFYLMVGLGLVFGVLLVARIGGADMPVVISLMNSYGGLAAAATGFALDNYVLIICGSLDGASGFILSIIMSRAMNRSFTNVLFAGVGAPRPVGAAAAGAEERTMRATTVEDAAVQLAYARSVIIVPGYGMAVAQAQHAVAELAEVLEQRGVDVKFAIHPVAGRMPGHMNVLLAEANVPYDKLYEMERINSEFERTDVALVVGANDVVNPAARFVKDSPIYGMPILNVDQARSIIVLKRGKGTGFSGIENELFYNPKCALLYGDAKATLTQLVAEIPKV